MQWFGENWGAPVCADLDHVDTPVGAVCEHCEEPVVKPDQGYVLDNGTVEHLECFLRCIFGSVNHQLGICSCYVPGASETDPPELTRRQAARLAVELFKKASDDGKTA